MRSRSRSRLAAERVGLINTAHRSLNQTDINATQSEAESSLDSRSKIRSKVSFSRPKLVSPKIASPKNASITTSLEFPSSVDDNSRPSIENVKVKFGITPEACAILEAEMSPETLHALDLKDLQELKRNLINLSRKHGGALDYLDAQRAVYDSKKLETQELLTCAEMGHEDRRSRFIESSQRAFQDWNELRKSYGEAQSLFDRLTEEKQKVLEEFQRLQSQQEEIQRDRENNHWECTATLQLGCQLNASIKELREARERLIAVRESSDLKRRATHNQLQELRGNLRVFCRIRPLLAQERLQVPEELLYTIDKDSTTISILSDGKQKSPFGTTISQINSSSTTSDTFTFDKIFDVHSSQKQVFDEVANLVQSALDGFNVCLFAYGQTGSGKTYTMDGGWDIIYNNWSSTLQIISQPTAGIIPRAIELIFNSMVAFIHKGWHYRVKLSALEIYNETVRDLLLSVGADTSDVQNPGNISARQGGVANSQSLSGICDIKLDQRGNVVVNNLTLLEVKNASDVFTGLTTAVNHRAVAATACNDRSSRSHSVVQLHIFGERSRDGKVDLAGSERLDRSLATGDRLKEAQHINRSLSCLCDVICAIAAKKTHIPFRNSKLTLLLRESLGGNAKTLMFVNISALKTSRSESINSLRFASKANLCSWQNNI